MYDSKLLAANIRKARLKRNYTQDYLAYKLKVSQNAYSKIELGYSALSAEKLVTIAYVLEVDVKQLLGMADLKADVEAISRIPVCRNLLDVVCRTTGMGFAAIARVTEDKWITCSVLDKISFGLKPGDELMIETTICNEIRQHEKPVAIDHVANDPIFAGHPTPAMYGFQSYISVPIMRRDGSFFGTLCAIDPKPAKVNNVQTINMFTLFGELISFHLDTVERMTFTTDRISEDEKKTELKAQFTQLLGNDLPYAVRRVLDNPQLFTALN